MVATVISDHTLIRSGLCKDATPEGIKNGNFTSFHSFPFTKQLHLVTLDWAGGDLNRVLQRALVSVIRERERIPTYRCDILIVLEAGCILSNRFCTILYLNDK